MLKKQKKSPKQMPGLKKVRIPQLRKEEPEGFEPTYCPFNRHSRWCSFGMKATL